MPTADQRFINQSKTLGYDFDGEIKIGGDYTAAIRDGSYIYISGQIPRVGDEVVARGAVGGDLSLAQARVAAAVSCMRGLALVQRLVGSLNTIVGTPRMTVYVRSAPDFTQQSEVADGASEVLRRVLGEAGVHTRTSVGVAQLPKGAAVEIDFIFKISDCVLKKIDQDDR